MASPLSEPQERLLKLFKQAIEGEQDAQELYADMQSNCEDPELKRVIESLRLTEQRHEEMLMSKYNELRGTDKYKD